MTLSGSGRSVLLFLAIHTCVATITNHDLAQIKCSVFNLADTYKGEPGDVVAPQPMLGKIVRLVFHDCIGGCDGHVDLKQKGTEGLHIPVFHLEQIYAAKFAPRMSRADFWAAAGAMAILKGSINAGKSLPKLKFYHGRKDGVTIGQTDLPVPNAYGGIQDVTSFCHNSFGMGSSETVALMGAHALGRASAKNTGFDGAWVEKSANFDNSFFVDLVRQKGWQVQKTAGGVNQWEEVNGQPGLMRLNSDIALYKDIGSPNLKDGSGLKCTTTAKCFPQQQAVTGKKGVRTTAELVTLYARDEDTWFNDFAGAFNKMVQVGAPKEGWKEVAYDYDAPCCCDSACPPFVVDSIAKTANKAAVAGKEPAGPPPPCKPLYAFPAGSLGLPGAKATSKVPVGPVVGATVCTVMVASGVIFGHFWLRSRRVGGKVTMTAPTLEQEAGAGTQSETPPVAVAQIVFDQRQSKDSGAE